MKSPWTHLVLLGGLLLQSAFFSPAQAAESTVSAELVVPPAETYVIGDRIPLYWRFTNRSTDPLGFMWEGCCRLNGRLNISRDGQAVTPIPPGQALAHMFAKAEVLKPGDSRDFDTFLSDWVVLPETGTYELHGRYTGVLDFQKPQVPRGVELWRAAAETATNRLSVLSVADYQKQRETRSQQRGLTLAFSGPLKFPLIGAADWSLQIINQGTSSRTVHWPVDFSLWVVNTNGFRETAVPSDIEDDYAEITLAPGQHVSKTVRLDYSRMEGIALGRYQVFLDLKTAVDGSPRLPSNPLPLFWQFTGDDVAQLITKAASGNRAGARNPALKFLRVYLAELEPLLDAVLMPVENPKESALLTDLKLAAALKSLAPQPGRKDWPLGVEASGAWQFADEKVRSSFASDVSVEAQVQSVLSVRRHLGLEMSFVLQPEAKATAAAWFTAVQALEPVQGDLTAPAYLKVLPQNTNNTGIVNLRTEAIPASVVMLLQRNGSGLSLRVAKKIPDAQSSASTTLFSGGDLKSMRTIASPEQLLAFINDPQLRTLQIQVFCPADTTFVELQQVLAPVWSKVNQVDLALAR